MTENSVIVFFFPPASHCSSVHFWFNLESIWYKPPELLNMQIAFPRFTTGALTCQRADVSSADNGYFCRVCAQLYIFCVQQESQRAVYFLPHIHCSDWQHALNSVSLSLCTTKESSAFVFKSSERQASRSRPSEDNLQWAGANLLSAYSEERGGRRKKKTKPNALVKGKNSFIYWLITTLFRNYTVKLLQKVTFHGCRRILFLINYPLITDRLIRDKYQRRPIPLGHVQYAPRAAIFVDLFGSKLALLLLPPLPESPGCAR